MERPVFSKQCFWHFEIGFNYRMTNLQAALGLGQFEEIENLIKRRRRNAKLYNTLLSNIPGLTLPVERKDVRNVYWMYALLVEKDFGMTREQLMRRLWKVGVDTRTFFIPMHQQPIFKKMKAASYGRFPVADTISRKGIYLPSGSGLKKDEIEFICSCIKKIRKKG